MSVCLAAKADGTRLKPMVVFRGGKREVAKLKEEFQHRAIVATSANGWMNTELTKVWVDSVVGAFAFNRRLLAWDSYECHMEDSITESLKSKKIDPVIVPGEFENSPEESYSAVDSRCMGRATNRRYQELFPKLRLEPPCGRFERRFYSLFQRRPAM